MTAIAATLADRALLLAEDPLPDEDAAAVELAALAGQDPQPASALLAALRLVGERGRATSAGSPSIQTGRAARLLVVALGRA
jgi:hypothetical protein